MCVCVKEREREKERKRERRREKEKVSQYTVKDSGTIILCRDVHYVSLHNE